MLAGDVRLAVTGAGMVKHFLVTGHPGLRLLMRLFMLRPP
jgi:hypothetical protein